MRISRVTVTNFRGLSRIVLDSAADVNVISGQNAAGKSTILEAMRLIKTVLSPRYYGEGQPVLTQLGLLHPHLQAIGSLTYDFDAIANEIGKNTVLSFTLLLTDGEIGILASSIDQLTLLQLQSEVNGPVDQLAFTQFLSSEPGRTRFQDLRKTTEHQVNALNSGTSLEFELTFDTVRKQIVGKNGFNHTVLAILDRRLPPDRTLISSFPADRAFPQGEQPLQVGSADAQAQVQAHMAVPATKYARLKQSIIQNVMLNPQGREILEREFNLIFDNLLPGKKLAGVSFNALGLLKVLVREEKSGRMFDIDQMSSGEKGLVLTFIFIRLTMERGGIILIDQPELHLNDAVQSKIMSFLIDHCIRPFSLQAFVCTHSPEIVRDAFQSDICNLFHLLSSTDLTPVLRQDMEPLFEIFSRLGSSTADLLSTRGNVYVEGEHDSAILQAGFADLLTGYQVQGLGGRAEIEREVPNFQAEEKAGRLRKLQLFVLDNDRKPTSVSSTDLVRVRQLKRYCMENYLLNDNILYDIVKQNALKEVESRGAFPTSLERLALSQIPEVALKEAYRSLAPDNPGLRVRDIRGVDCDEAIETLADRVYKISEQVKVFNHANWITSMKDIYTKRLQEITEDWKTSWKEKCNGKRLVDSLYERYEIRMAKIEFKKEVMRRLALDKAEEWSVIRDIIATELK